MIIVSTAGRPVAIKSGTAATAKQVRRFKQIAQHEDRFISAKLAINLLIVTYKTKADNIIEAVFDKQGYLIHKHFYNSNKDYITTKHFY